MKKISVLFFLLILSLFQSRGDAVKVHIKAPVSVKSIGSWSLLVLPSESELSQDHWIKILEKSNLSLTLAFSPEQLSRIKRYRSRLLELKKQGKLEACLQLDGNPSLPILIQMDSVKPFLPSDVPLPNVPIQWPEDLADQLVRAKEKFRNFWGEMPRGFVPGEGSLSLTAAEFLKDEKFSWGAAGLPRNEYPSEDRSSYVLKNFFGKTSFHILPAHRLSNLLQDPKGPFSNSRVLKNMFSLLQSTVSIKVTPLVVLDTTRSNIRLTELLQECSRNQKQFKHRKMVLCSEIPGPGDKNNLSFQLSPYSWEWVRGCGRNSGPGLTVWVGDPQKNTAWEILAQTRQTLMKYRNSGRANLLQFNRALEELYSAESGDFFKYLGPSSPNHPEFSNVQYEKKMLFQATLANVYRILQIPVPEELQGSSFLKGPIQSGSQSPQNTGSLSVAHTTYSVVWSESQNPWEGDPQRGSAPTIQEFSVQLSSSGMEEMLFYQIALKNEISTGSYYVDLYMDINHVEGAGNTDLIRGKGVQLRSRDGWEYLISTQIENHSHWKSQLFRENHETGSDDAVAIPGIDGHSFQVRIPRGLLGRDPLRWGYLVCIIDKDTNKILDLFTSVPDRRSLLLQIDQAGENTESSENRVMVPMLRVE